MFMISRLLLLLCLTTGESLRLAPLTATAGLHRRQALAVGAASGLALLPCGAHAAQDPEDLQRLRKGLESVQYLLDNWEKETVDPITGDDSPDRVRFYLGLRTTDHPLFQVDKLLTKAQKKLSDDVDIEEWIDAVEGQVQLEVEYARSKSTPRAASSSRRGEVGRS